MWREVRYEKHFNEMLETASAVALVLVKRLKRQIGKERYTCMRDEIRERKKKISFTPCGLKKKIGRGEGEEGMCPEEMSYLTVKLSILHTLGALLCEDANND